MSFRFRQPINSRSTFIGVAVITIIILLLTLAFWGAIGYVAIHFIAKIW